ncbi:MAG: peptidylprolyl isomerase [Nautiliaceae bacterium]
MIEWMQKHKKWLVITIWVATIAFIGAGFVGWGQFQFGKKASIIAKVGDEEVSIREFQFAYNNLFNDLNQKLGGKLDEATANKLGLKQIALNQVIDNALLREYAKSLGLYVTDEDVAKKILEYFHDKKTYKEYLKRTNQTAKEFETLLKKQLLVEKLLNMLNLTPPKNAILAVGSALYNADNLSLKIINSDEVNVSINLNKVKNFWKTNKEKYKTPPTYKIALVTINLEGNVSNSELKNFYEANKLNYKNKNGEILSFNQAKNRVKEDYLAKNLKKEAILAYKKLKTLKGEYEIKEVAINNSIVPFDKMQELIKNGIIKPFVYKGKYITAKLLEEIKPRVMSFEEAKAYVIKDYLDAQIIKVLKIKAQKALNNFDGKNIGWITKYDFSKIPIKNGGIAEEFLLNLFTSYNKEGYFLLPLKNPKMAFVYKINDQKILDKKEFEKNKIFIEKLTQNLMQEELLKDLIKHLREKYKIEIYLQKG